LKKLDKLIIKSFIGPFVATFFITLFVLVMQFFWLWIDDFVGKGLDALTILTFIWYQSAVLIPLALPLAVLLSSLMTFGNLGETFELVAIKSAGISLLRFMSPLFVVAVGIGIGAFLFSNFVIPVANLKARTLLADIVLAKPAFAIQEGVFYDKLDGFAIKIGTKEPNDSVIRDVIVYEQNNLLQDNFIVAKSGIMKPSPDKHFLDIHFKNGWRYQERGNPSDSSTEYVRLGFKDYKKQFDISSFNFKASADSNNRNNERVYSMRQLDVAIDSMARFAKADKERFDLNMLASFGLLAYPDSIAQGTSIPDSVFNFRKNRAAYMGITSFRRAIAGQVADSLKRILKNGPHIRKKPKIAVPDKPKTVSTRTDTTSKPQTDSTRGRTAKDSSGQVTGKDSATARKTDSAHSHSALLSTKKEKKDPDSFDAILPDSARQSINERALGVISSAKTNIETNENSLGEQFKDLRRYKIEWHRKISLALACVVLFMIGAPLGSIIRKGGLGTPLIFAITFFMIFYFVSTRGEKLAKEGVITPFHGMWLATYVLVPIGLFLTYKAMHDSNLFNKEFYVRLKRNFFRWAGRLKSAKKGIGHENLKENDGGS
jgi:lipopolysaccharide export system permease protein